MIRATPPDVGPAYIRHHALGGRFVRSGFMLLQQKFGYRFDRRDDMDEVPSPDPDPRDERLREAVDALPQNIQIAISRMYFGADRPGLQKLADELGITVDVLKARLEIGYEILRKVLSR